MREYKNRLIDIENRIKTSVKSQEEHKKSISESETKSDQLKKERIAVLPLEETVEHKRKSLQLLRKELADKLELSKKELQKQLDIQRDKEAIKQENKKEQAVLKSEHISLKSTLDAQISESDFESKEAIEKALLSQEEKKIHAK